MVAQINVIEATVRCRPFGGKINHHRVRVEKDGSITVYDPIAGHFTVCHQLSLETQARLAKYIRESVV